MFLTVRCVRYDAFCGLSEPADCAKVVRIAPGRKVTKAMQMDLATLKERVLETAKGSAVSAQVEDVLLESDSDGEGTAFLRVVVQLKDTAQAVDADLEALLEAIEGAVGAIDERYPSVRFSDAA